MSDPTSINSVIDFATAWKPVVEAIGLVLIPVVVGVALWWTAKQQERTNKQRLRAELYERRLRAYKAVDGFLLAIVNRDFPIATHDLIEALTESHFLFGEEIPTYIEEVYKNATRLVETVNRLADTTSEEERDRLQEKEENLFTYFEEQRTIARSKFQKDLRLQ